MGYLQALAEKTDWHVECLHAQAENTNALMGYL